MMDVRVIVETLKGRPIAVFGLGLSGLSVVRAFRAAGADVLAWDDNERVRAQAEELGARCVPLQAEELGACAFLVLAPGVPLHFPQPHEVVLAARAAGIEIIGDLELLYRLRHGRRTVGITGTNGKSTTTALTAHILEHSGRGGVAGGNIGRPVLDLDMPAPDATLVLEISSYQVDLCPTFRPDIAVLTNITPDHIDRHGSFEEYTAAKERLFEGEGAAVIEVDDDPGRKIHERLLAFETGKRLVIPVSCTRELEYGIYVQDGHLYDAMNRNKPGPWSLKGITTLAGRHNHQNAAMAFAVCRLIGMESEEIIEQLKTYPGLPHRQLTVRTINGVAYINDSKATNAVSAGTALAAYENIYWIVGGRPKAGGLEGLEGLMPRVRHAFVIGEAMEEFSSWLTQLSVEHTNAGTLQSALDLAHAMAQGARGQPGGAGVVLLSPACASFDQFSSFEQRGIVFETLVAALPGEETP
jgi:UDP-N-acetylmuramoylalanine--D-glutamate ligase